MNAEAEKGPPLAAGAAACRVCGSRQLHRWAHLPQMPFTEELRPVDNPAPVFLADIDVYLCGGCGVSMTIHEPPISEYYTDYHYTASASGIAGRFMDRLAETLFQRFKLAPGCRVVEVGSGDGAQLGAFRQRGAEVLGFEPSALLCAMSRERGIPVVEGLFNAGSVSLLPAPFQQADVLLMTYTFDHLPDPSGALAAARQMIDPERGLLVLEVHDLELIVRRREYCLFEHEHFTYWTANTIREALARCGFKLLTTGLLPERERRGNSLLLAAAPVEAACEPDQSAHAVIREADTIDYDGFQREMEKGIALLDSFVERETAAGRAVAGFGGGGRGVMTMAAMRSAFLLRFVCDSNRALHGTIAPKSGVRIVGIEELVKQPVDTLLVFSYGYMDEIAAAVRRLQQPPATIVSMLEVLEG